MNKILFLLLLLPGFVFGQTTDATLTTQAQQIKNETAAGANTANRVGTHLQNLVYSKKSFFIDGTASGTDTYSVSLDNGAITALTSQWFVIKFTNANTGAATLNINAIGAKSLKKTDGTALSADDIDAGSVHLLSYDGTNLQVLSLGGGGGSWPLTGTGTLTGTTTITGSNTNAVHIENVTSFDIESSGGGTGAFYVDPTLVQFFSPNADVELNSDGYSLTIDAGSDFRINADPGTATQVLTSNGANNPPTWEDAAAGGGGTPGGSTTQVQYNNAGAFGGITGATTNGTVMTLTNAIVGTQSANDNSTKAASTAYADAKVVDGTITNGTTTTAPSQDDVFDALSLKQDLVNSATTLTDASTIDLTAIKHTLATSSATRTFTISYTGDDIVMEVTLSTTATTFTFPAAALCISEGVASGDNTCALLGSSGDKYIFSIKKIGSAYYVVAKNFGQ